MLDTLPRGATRATLTGQAFFPHLISGPFHARPGRGVRRPAAAMSVIAALASLLRGGRYVHDEEGEMDFLDPQVPAPVRDR